MSEPFLWGSPFSLPSGIRMPHITTLSNGTFLIVGKAGTFPDEKLKAWIYNADGSLKAEQVLDVPDPGPGNTADSLDLLAIDPMAVELPGGRIAITWTVSTPSSGGTYVAPWVCIYGADLKPVGAPKPVFDPTSGARDYAESVVALADGTLVISDRNERDGHAYLRVFSPDGTRSPALDLGAAGSNMLDTIVTDIAALSDGNVAVVVQTNASTLTGYVLTPSGSGGPSLSAPFSITTSASPIKGDIKVTALQGGGFVVTWTEQASDGPSYNAFLEVFDANGHAVSDVKPVPSITHPELLLASNSDVLALPNGGFAIAYEKSTKLTGGVEGFEVYLALFDKSGSRVTDDIRVSDLATTKSINLEELLLLADGRILVRHSQGIQIVDPRDKAVSLNGTAGNDQYIGTSFNDSMDGGNGADSLVGAEGNDMLKGGGGSDTLYGGAGADILGGGDGIDFVSFLSATAGVTASLSGGTGGDAAGDTYISIEGLIGSSFNDIFTGNGSAILRGRGGDDTYHVRAGDTVEEAAREGRDTVIASSSYALRADAEIEVVKLAGLARTASASVTGSDIANILMGHSGKNSLKGQGGDDKLYGGQGNDTLTGGTGKDIFVFNTTPNKKTNLDRITDFKPKDDTIWLDNAIFKTLGKKGSEAKPALLSSKAFWKGSAAHDASDRIIYDKKTGALYYDKDGTGAAAPVKIATLSKNLPITYKDFFVI